MKKIKLTQNKVALIDDEDFDNLSKHNWYVAKRGYGYYAQRMVKRKIVQMHRVILNVNKDEQIDHINRNTLDNRRCNLRVANHSQNEWNRGKQKNNHSGYKGVIYSGRDKIFTARIRVYSKLIHLGTFKDKKEAARAYNEAAKRYHGEFACINKI